MPFRANVLLAELPRLRRYARVLTDDPQRADRLVEETLARARRMQDGSAHEVTPRGTQLLALLRSVHASQAAVARETARTASGDGRDDTGASPSKSAEPSPPDRAAHMLAQLRRLPLEQREVLVLVAVERMSYQDIAALLHTPVATVISRLSQAREALRAGSPKPLSAPNAN